MSVIIESGITEAVVSSKGGTVKSFTKGGIEIFFPWRMRGDNERGGCPMCVPWFGLLPHLSSSPRSTKKHGYLRDSLACEREVHASTAEFRFYLPGNEFYPWSLKCITRASVSTVRSQSVLEMMLSVERMHDNVPGAAPILPAFHPYFAFPAAETIVEVGRNKIWKITPTPTFHSLNGQTLVTVRASKRKVDMYFQYDSPPHRKNGEVVLWSDSGDEYSCVEPVLESNTRFGTPDGRHLAEGERVTLSVTFAA